MLKDCSLFLMVEQLSSKKALLSPSWLRKFLANAFANSVLPNPFAPDISKKGACDVLWNASK